VTGDTSVVVAVPDRPAIPKGPRDLTVLEAVALAATRNAAIACQPFVGRGGNAAARVGEYAETMEHELVA
jgi:hypothetical protein